MAMDKITDILDFDDVSLLNRQICESVVCLTNILFQFFLCHRCQYLVKMRKFRSTSVKKNFYGICVEKF